MTVRLHVSFSVVTDFSDSFRLMCYFSRELWLVILTGIDMAGFRVAVFNIWVVCCFCDHVTLLLIFYVYLGSFLPPFEGEWVGRPRR